MATVALPSRSLLDIWAPLQPVPECPDVLAYQVTDLGALWQGWEREAGGECPVPFWSVVWPGARVLAAYLLDNPAIVQGKRVLDFGCGSGVVACAAAKAGATRVVGNDIDHIACAVGKMQARENGVTLEWVEKDITGTTPDGIDCICVADMFYQCTESSEHLEWLLACSRRGIEVYITDGERPFAPREQGTVISTVTLPVSRDVEGVDSRRVRLIRL